MRRLSCIPLVLGLLLGACDRAPSSSPAGAKPGAATAPAATQSATTEPATRPAISVITINGHEIQFPRARLRLAQKEPNPVLVLFTDDPKQAIEDDYHGNSYYLTFPLTIESLDQLDAATYRFEAPSSERQDTPDGIFLDGVRSQLQPFNVAVDFDRSGRQVLIHIRGLFLLFNNREQNTPPLTVAVSATLAAELESK